MRVNEKLFWTLLQVGIDRYLDGSKNSAQRKAFVQTLTDCMKQTVLGNMDNQTEYQWKFPLKDGKYVDPRSMTNVHSRKCVQGIKALAYKIFHPSLDEESK
jgi:hypothetical protein